MKNAWATGGFKRLNGTVGKSKNDRIGGERTWIGLVKERKNTDVGNFPLMFK